MTWNIKGHDWAVEMLLQHIARGTKRHAYLFSGPPGVGRRTIALSFAQALNCTKPPEPGVPCEACRACRQIGQLQHPDLSIVQAEQEGGSIKVDQIRKLQRSLSLSPYESRYRVALLMDFEGATASTQNALLKTLEEAPEKVILLLTANSPENLLPTITSRCEILRLRPLRLDRIAGMLREDFEMSADEALRLAHLSGGKPGLAYRLAENPDLLQENDEQIENLISLLGSNLRARFAFAEQFRPGSKRNALREVLQTWLLFWRDVMLTGLQSQVPLVNLKWKEQIDHMVKHIDAQQARIRVTDLEEALNNLETTNINAQMLVEVLLLDWPRLRAR